MSKEIIVFIIYIITKENNLCVYEVLKKNWIKIQYVPKWNILLKMIKNIKHIIIIKIVYIKVRNEIYETAKYFKLFLRNLLFEENNELHNRFMHISGKFDEQQKADIEQ